MVLRDRSRPNMRLSLVPQDREEAAKAKRLYEDRVKKEHKP